ncbi:hypothetical protein QJS10_CPB11g00341 [Acorus calamus]|uniref:CCR4-NOT transcription complex subunit 1 n=1 Tax=Acorus calamus TaxID=4465 RepID=A0AAV9DV29_ACOCL|nr:hypothetical protein QJS10_CPB11g00341 [Acorus calamus]
MLERVRSRVGISRALSDFRRRGQNFCISQIEELYENPSVISHELIQDIMMFLFRSEGLAKHVDTYTKMLSLLQLKERTPFILAPMVADVQCNDNSLSCMDIFSESSENDFDAILAEIEKEMSMADVIRELGYECTVDSAHCKELLSLFLPLNEVTLAKILSTIVQTQYELEDCQSTHSTFCSAIGSSVDYSLLSSWNVDILVDSIKQLVPELDWIRVMENLDHDGFYIPDEGAFSLLMSIYAYACQSIAELHRNNNSSGNVNQAWSCLDLLEMLCQLAERGHASPVRMMLENPLRQCPETLLVGIAHVNTAYNLIQYEVFSTVFPLIVGNSTKGGIVQHLWHVNPNLILWGFIDAHASNPDIISRISDLCQEFEILALVLDTAPFEFSIKLAAFAFHKEHVNLEKWLYENLIIYKDAFFQVLQDQAGRLVSDQLAEEVKKLQVAFMHFNLMNQGAGASDLPPPTDGTLDNTEIVVNAYFHQMFSGQLSIVEMVQMLERFKESSDKREQAIIVCMINNLFEEYKFFPKYPEMQLNIVSVFFGALIKHQLVTHHALSVALCAVLDALRESVDSKMFMFGTKALEQFVDRLVEWPQYCDHILQISHLHSTHAELFSFIEHGLARISSSQSESNDVKSAAVHHVSANATTEESSETSLQQLSSGTIQSVQQFSSPIVQPNNHGFLEDRAKPMVSSENYTKHSTPAGKSSLVYLDTSNQKTVALQSLQAISSSFPSSVPLSVSSSSGGLLSTQGISPAGRQHSYNTGFGAALNIDTLVAAAEKTDTPIKVLTPASDVQDKILFMINNMSATNMDAKSKEFIEIMKEEYYPWFAQYLVMKRASIEPNFHDLYLKFLEKINLKSLDKEIVKATYENCKILLRSELIKSSSEERSLLKNLGSWLGKLTIGRNQTLRGREIDPKVLIIEILEPCQSSLAYQPPNPWTMGILGLLVEIYALPNLKMNLKFDIEVLFRNIGVDMKDVKPTSLLKDHVREVEGNPDFSNKDVLVSQRTVVADHTGMISTLNQVEFQPAVFSASHPSHANVLAQYTAPLHLVSKTVMEDDKLGSVGLPKRIPPGPSMSQVTPLKTPLSASQLSSTISNIGINVVVNQKLNAFSIQFHRIITAAMNRAIKDIIASLVQRNVSIASQTTRELILKDYALESDESHICNAARGMMASLAGSLTNHSCKELLRKALSSHLRSLLQTMTVANDLLEQIIQLIIHDNLESGCSYIKQATTEKALLVIDGEMDSLLSIRRNKRDGSTFNDSSTYAQGFARVPEALRPKPGHLSATQQRVYDDFVRSPWQNQPSQSSNAFPEPLASGSLVGSSVSHGYGSSQSQLNSTLFSSPQVTPGFGAHSLSLISKDAGIGLTHILSSSAHDGGSDRVIQNAAEISTVAPPFPPTVATTDMNSVETSSVGRDLKSVVQPSPTTPTERMGISMLTTGDALEKYQILDQKLEALISKDTRDVEIPGIITEVSDIILRCESRDAAALAIAQKVFKSLYENTSNNFLVNCHLALLAAIRDVCKLVVKELTSWVIYSDEERKFNTDITVGLIHSELLNLTEYNVHLAKLIDGGRNKAAMDFAISLVQTLVNQESGVSVSEFYNVIDVLAKLAMRPGSPESLQQLVDIAKKGSSNGSSLPGYVNKEERGNQLRDKKVASGCSMTNREVHDAADSAATNPPGFRDQVSVLFSEWCRMCELPATSEASYAHFISQLHQKGLLKGDDVTDCFFRILTELSVGHCLSEGQFSQQALSFIAVDTYAKLVYFVVKYWPVDQGLGKVILFPKVLSVVVRVIQNDAEEKGTSFNPRPFFRLFINWLSDLTSDPVLEVDSFQIDLLPEMAVPPRILSEVDGALKEKRMKADIDEYFKAVLILQNKFSLPTQENLDILQGGAAMDIFQTLVRELDTEGRYLFLNAAANQLRYPNSHTHYYSFLLLHLFLEANQEIIQEQITRVLLERVVGHRPQPWGVIVTFLELVKNQKYNFWSQSYIRCAPEIKNIFDSLARSCEGMVSGTISDNIH